MVPERSEMAESDRLNHVADWFSTTQPGFDNRLTIYSAMSLEPFFRGSRALEVGAADGQMTEILLRSFAELTVVEGSETYCKTLHKKFGSQIQLYCALIESFDIEKKFDTILLAHILEHVEDPIYVLTHMGKFLADNGRILIAVPNANSFHRLVAVKMGLLNTPDQFSERDKKLGHRRIYTMESLLNDIRIAGFKTDATGGIFFKPLTNKQIEDVWTDQMMDGFYELGKDFPGYAAEIFAVCHR